jgi:hypothetical protein
MKLAKTKTSWRLNQPKTMPSIGTDVRRPVNKMKEAEGLKSNYSTLIDRTAELEG